MRPLLVSVIVLCGACVKAPHEAQLDYAEFDKAPDYVWRPYANAAEDEERKAYWSGYQAWLCERIVDADGHWKAGETTSVQRTVACGDHRRDQRRHAEAVRNETFQQGVAALEVGMEEDQVRTLLGRPSAIAQSADESDTGARWIYRDASRRHTVLELRFQQGQLEHVEQPQPD